MNSVSSHFKNWSYTNIWKLKAPGGKGRWSTTCWSITFGLQLWIMRQTDKQQTENNNAMCKLWWNALDRKSPVEGSKSVHSRQTYWHTHYSFRLVFETSALQRHSKREAFSLDRKHHVFVNHLFIRILQYIRLSIKLCYSRVTQCQSIHHVR